MQHTVNIFIVRQTVCYQMTKIFNLDYINYIAKRLKIRKLHILSTSFQQIMITR